MLVVLGVPLGLICGKGAATVARGASPPRTLLQVRLMITITASSPHASQR